MTKPLNAIDQFGNTTITVNNAEAWALGSNINGWKVTEIKTDMDSGNLQDFIKKEGKWFGYIKGKHVVTDVLDTSRFSVQGIGFASTINDISTATSDSNGDGTTAPVVAPTLPPIDSGLTGGGTGAGGGGTGGSGTGGNCGY